MSRTNSSKERCNPKKTGKAANYPYKNGKESARKPSRKGGYTRDPNPSIPETNDSSWYTANAKLVEASARIPFPYRPGLNVPQFFTNCNNKLTVTNVNATAKIPGVFAIDWAPAVGISNDVTSPISLAARDIFSKVRSAFSGSIQADAPDFIIHMMAMDSIYAYISYLKRMYKTIVTYNSDNQITPEIMMRAMGWSSADIYNLMAHKVEFFGVINELVSMTNRFFTPNVMPVFQRHVWMSERVYADAPTVNSQMYLFNLTHVYKFGTDEQGAGKLTLTAVPTSGTVSDLFTFGRELIQAVSDWDDGYIINGYLAKAYDTTARFQIAPLNLDDRLELVYNEVVLSQIENATCAPVQVKSLAGTVTQNISSNALISSYSATPEASQKDYGNAWTVNRINCRSEQPTAIDAIEASRLMTKWDMSMSVATVVECGTEVVSNFRIMLYVQSQKEWHSANINNMVLTTQFTNQMTSSVMNKSLSAFIDAIVTFSAFDWHPIMLTGAQTRSGSDTDLHSTDYIGILGDIHNITFISDDDMAYINRCCLYSEFGSFGD